MGVQRRKIWPHAEVMESSQGKWHLNWGIKKKNFSKWKKEGRGFTTANGMRKVETGTSQVCAGKKADGRKVARVSARIRSCRMLVCKSVRLCFICEDIRTRQGILNRRVLHPGCGNDSGALCIRSSHTWYRETGLSHSSRETSDNGLRKSSHSGNGEDTRSGGR